MTEINKSLNARLKRLFSNNVVVRRIGGKNLKVLDTNRLQSAGNLEQTKYVDRYTRLHGLKTTLSTYNTNYNYHSSRTELYTDYESMDQHALISSALDIYADQICVKNEFDEILEVTSSDENIKKVLHNLFYDILNIEFNLWPWVRNMCKYGDLYLYLDIREDIGIVNVTPLSSYEVVREEGNEYNPYHVQFSVLGQNKKKFENHEVAHFRLLSDANFLHYGKSLVENARKTWKQIVLLEDAMLISRVMRAPERRIFKIDVGNIPPNEVDNYMQQIMSKMKKQPYMDPNTGDYDLKFNLMNMLEDFYLPTRGANSGTEIDTLPGMEFTGIDDINYLKDLMFAAIKIPKAWLSMDEAVGGKATLASEDVRFARTVERIQRIVLSELTKIAVIHLFAQGYTDEELINFELNLTIPSIIYEQEKVELGKNKIDWAVAIQDSKLFSAEWIYKHIYKLSEDEIMEEQNNIIEDAKTRFRIKQIEDEGNDPVLTGESFGTPHDIASMQISVKDTGNIKESNKTIAPKGGWPGAGRPRENSSVYGTDSHKLGRDPIGSTATKKLKESGRASKAIIHTLGLSNTKSKNIILESLSKKSVNNIDEGTFLDESNISE